MERCTGILPGGYWDSAGVLHREFELAVLTGRDEELLVQARPAETASLVTAVLSRCVRRLGRISPVSEEITRQLLVADRQYLLLKLRQATFGGLVRGDVFCPWPECGTHVSVEFTINDVPIVEAVERAPFFDMTLSVEACGEEGEAWRQISFRLPNGADQEVASPLLSDNEAQALTQILIGCLRRIGSCAPPSAERVAALSALARSEIEIEMERLAPRIELDMETNCPECGRPFVVPFDLHRFFFGALRADTDLLYRDVHYLAYHYHWSEREIMEMTREKRRQYVDSLAGEIERLNYAG